MLLHREGAVDCPVIKHAAMARQVREVPAQRTALNAPRCLFHSAYMQYTQPKAQEVVADTGRGQGEYVNRLSNGECQQVKRRAQKAPCSREA